MLNNKEFKVKTLKNLKIQYFKLVMMITDDEKDSESNSSWTEKSLKVEKRENTIFEFYFARFQ